MTCTPHCYVPRAMDDVEAPEQRRRHREWELDVLVAHELATASPAATVLWQAVGQTAPSPPVTVTRQAVRDDGRTTDVQAEADDGRLLLCENKAAGGSFGYRQPESYANHCAQRSAWAVTVGPRSWVTANRDSHFDGHVAVEDLATALLDAAECLPADDPVSAELRASYEYRARQLLDYASDDGYVGNPNSSVAAIGELYRRLLADLTAGSLNLTPNALRNETAAFAHVRGFTVGARKVIHKIDRGAVDLGCTGWTMPELRSWYSALATDARPPIGWSPDSPDSKGTPVLRYTVEPIDPRTVTIDKAEAVIRVAIGAMLELEAWLADGGGAVLDAGPRPQAS